MSENTPLHYRWVWIFGVIITLVFIWFLSYLANLIPKAMDEDMTQTKKTNFSFHNQLPERQSVRQERYAREVQQTQEKQQNNIANQYSNNSSSSNTFTQPIQQKPNLQPRQATLQQPQPQPAPAIVKAPIIITADPIGGGSIKPKSSLTNRTPVIEQAPVQQIGRGTVLQAGSFTNWEDADRRRAELAMLGLESKIQQARLGNGQVWNRVIVGPFDSPQALNSAQNMLSRNRISFYQKQN